MAGDRAMRTPGRSNVITARAPMAVVSRSGGKADEREGEDEGRGRGSGTSDCVDTGPKQ
jgi:hypothetical protein